MGKKSKTKLVTLSEPIQANGEDISVLEIREPLAEDLDVMDEAQGGEAAKMRHLVAHLAGIPPSSMKKVKAKDYLDAAGVVADFLGIDLKTGLT